MKAKLDDRLKALEAEQEAGRKVLADLEARRQTVVETMLRIEGAIQILRELGAGQDARAAPAEIAAERPS